MKLIPEDEIATYRRAGCLGDLALGRHPAPPGRRRAAKYASVVSLSDLQATLGAMRRVSAA
jgi:hypothetical protein